jgi:hypothetical protein
MSARATNQNRQEIDVFGGKAMCVPEYVYGMILIESQGLRTPRNQVAETTSQRPWAIALISLLETCYSFNRLFLDDPAGMQA